VTLSFLIKSGAPYSLQSSGIPVTVKYTARYSYSVALLMGYGEGTNHLKHRISIFAHGN
jgi:hypothetical protein